MPYTPRGTMIVIISVIFATMRRSVLFNLSLINRLMQCNLSFRYIQTHTTAVLHKVYIKRYISTEFTEFFWTFSIVLYSKKNTKFRKLDLFPSSGEGGGEDTYSVGPLRES
jgi:hypothetical protein